MDKRPRNAATAAHSPRLAKRLGGVPLGLSLVLIGLLALTGCKPPKVSPIIFRVMTYNIHHGEGLDGKVDLDRIAKVITDANADAVALQEVDKNTERTGGIDMAADLAKRTNMHVAFGANLDFQGGKYGTAILSKHPIDSVENHVLKQARDGEPRGVLQAVLDVGQGRVLFAGTHLDHTKDQAERLFSQTQFDELFAKFEGLPIIFCGDFNDTPDSELHKRMSKKWTDSWSLVGQGPGLTMTSAQPTRRIDYIWVSDKKNFKLRWARVPRTDASDHLPVVAEMEFKPAAHPMDDAQLALIIIVMTLLSAIPIGLGATIFISSRRSKTQA
ncbi:MAG: endonuclease/exonuclease/phosphatase family protein [Verrucomicrobiota bacterium]|nr:endonuclease/exonuclease/phosphatase family protein [Verrucomicrobiota bacterium]